jgi:2-oxoglutarate ferredoxin oxidoreductase subunit gamma
MRHCEMIFSGSGGQGLMFIGKMLARLAIDEYPYVTFLPTYGAEVRSGTSYCNIKLSDEPIPTPVVDWPDVMVLMNQPSVDRFLPRLRVGKIAFVNSSMAAGNACDGVVEIPANQIALELGDVQVANMVMFGAMLGRQKIIDRNKALEAVRAASAAKGQPYVGLNQQAFQKGWELGASAGHSLQQIV